MMPLPPIVVRDGLEDVYNTIKNANLSAGHNTTYSGIEVTRNHDTVTYKLYIAFMIFGCIAAALIIPVAYSPKAISW